MILLLTMSMMIMLILLLMSITQHIFEYVGQWFDSFGACNGLLTLGLIPLGLISRWAITIRAKPTWSIFHLV